MLGALRDKFLRQTNSKDNSRRKQIYTTTVIKQNKSKPCLLSEIQVSLTNKGTRKSLFEKSAKLHLNICISTFYLNIWPKKFLVEIMQTYWLYMKPITNFTCI